MNEKEVEMCLRQVIDECESLEIPIDKRISPNITINKRAKSRFACCKKTKLYSGESFCIEVTDALLSAEDETIKEILFHEVLHTCPKCYNHGPEWKHYADKINKHYGYRIKATATYEELGLKAPDIKKKINYIIVCQKCGKQFYRQKRSKIVMNPNLYRCICGGKLNIYKAER